MTKTLTEALRWHPGKSINEIALTLNQKMPSQQQPHIHTTSIYAKDHVLVLCPEVRLYLDRNRAFLGNTEQAKRSAEAYFSRWPNLLDEARQQDKFGKLFKDLENQP